MRFFLVAFVLLPQLGWAQLFGGGFQDGSYVLRENRYLRMPGQLKLQSGSQLAVKYADGDIAKLTPEQVASFQIGSQHYVTASGFHVIGGIGGVDVDLAFVEQLDSGQLVLMRYVYTIASPMTMNAGGGMTANGSTGLRTYLLSTPTIPGVVAAQAGAYSSGGKKFREAVRPYFNGRPDLQKQLADKRITAENLPDAVRAFNTNSPYFAPR